MGFIGGLVAQEIPPRPGLVPQAVHRLLPLPQREGHGAIGVAPGDLRHHIGYKIRGKGAVLPALEDKGAKAPAVALLAAIEDGLFGEAVAGEGAVIPADAAVVAVGAAIVGALDEAADVNAVSKPLLPLCACQGKERLPVELMAAGKKRLPLCLGEAAVGNQLGNQLIHGTPWSRAPCRRPPAACPPSPKGC